MMPKHLASCFFTGILAWLIGGMVSDTVHAGVIFSIAQSQDDPDDPQEIRDLILAMDETDSPRERDRLFQKLLRIGAPVLQVLQSPPRGLSRQTELALLKLKNDLEKKANTQRIEPTRMTLQGSFTIAEALSEIEKQTQIPVHVSETAAKKLAGQSHKLELNQVPFWQGIDRVLHAFELELALDAEAGYQVIPGGSGVRWDVPVVYNGPLRIVPVSHISSFAFGNATGIPDRMRIGVQWEPTLTPFELDIDHARIEAVDESGNRYRSPTSTAQKISINRRATGTTIDVRFQHIPRKQSLIKTLTGQFTLMAAVGRRPFRFDLAGRRTLRQADMTVSVPDVKFGERRATVRMEFVLNRAGDALASHHGWMFNNRAYLEVGETNARILPKKMVTTLQEKDKMGFEFQFELNDELPNGPKGYHFIYESPTSVREIPVRFEFRDIELR